MKEFSVLVIYRYFSVFLNYCNALWEKEPEKEGKVSARAAIRLLSGFIWILDSEVGETAFKFLW